MNGTDLAGATARPQPGAFPATAGEFAALWNGKTETERDAWVQFMVGEAQAAQSAEQQLVLRLNELIEAEAVIENALFQIGGHPVLYPRELVKQTLSRYRNGGGNTEGTDSPACAVCGKPSTYRLGMPEPSWCDEHGPKPSVTAPTEKGTDR